ncbi:MMPL family transporter, partial [Streptomyces sp. URMC 126]|uniref:MMPL family transporter n=1 Tax=Streptomyces sp. URMC 126 TaxID=3423401 RepID=UPI003F1BB07E
AGDGAREGTDGFRGPHWSRDPRRSRTPRRSRASRPATGRISGAVLGPVLGRPGLMAAAATAVLLVLALPALGMRTEQLGLERQMPSDAPLRTSYERITAAFPGGPAPAKVVVRADDVTSPRFTAAVGEFTRRAAESGRFGKDVTVTPHPRERIAEILVPLGSGAGSGSRKSGGGGDGGGGTGDGARRALDTLREDLVPHILEPVAREAKVTGPLAASVDFNDRLGRGIVPVFLFITTVTFLLMLLSFRSWHVAAASVVLNLLSVAAAYGVLTAVFQHGWGASWLGVEPAGAVEAWLPLFVLVVLFGLSMDYHVFVVSRIREARLSGLTTPAAIRDGIRATAGAVTGAAAIMVAVFAVFATLSMQDMRQMGVGLAVAVLLDATVVRMVLLPAVLALLGERSGWSPRRVRDLADPGTPTAHPARVTARQEPDGGTYL